MKTIIHLASVLAIATITYNASAEAVRQQQTTVAGVQRVVFETPGDIEILPGTEERMTVEAEPEVLRQLENTLQQETLYLRSKGSFSTKHKIRYVLLIPRLQSLLIRGSGEATVGAFRGDTLDIELGGSGNAVVKDIEFDRLTLRVSGSGHIEASGRSHELVAEISGSGGIRAENLAAAHAEAKISGAGNIGVNVSKILKAVISGAGSIRYQGDPEISRFVSGAGSVRPF